MPHISPFSEVKLSSSHHTAHERERIATSWFPTLRRTEQGATKHRGSRRCR